MRPRRGLGASASPGSGDAAVGAAARRKAGAWLTARFAHELIFDAEAIDFEVRLTSSSLARLFFRIRLPYTGEVRDFDHEDLEARLRAAVEQARSAPATVARMTSLTVTPEASLTATTRLIGQDCAAQRRAPPIGTLNIVFGACIGRTTSPSRNA